MKNKELIYEMINASALVNYGKGEVASAIVEAISVLFVSNNFWKYTNEYDTQKEIDILVSSCEVIGLKDIDIECPDGYNSRDFSYIKLLWDDGIRYVYPIFKDDNNLGEATKEIGLIYMQNGYDDSMLVTFDYSKIVKIVDRLNNDLENTLLYELSTYNDGYTNKDVFLSILFNIYHTNYYNFKFINYNRIKLVDYLENSIALNDFASSSNTKTISKQINNKLKESIIFERSIITN